MKTGSTHGNYCQVNNLFFYFLYPLKYNLGTDVFCRSFNFFRFFFQREISRYILLIISVALLSQKWCCRLMIVKQIVISQQDLQWNECFVVVVVVVFIVNKFPWEFKRLLYTSLNEYLLSGFVYHRTQTQSSGLHIGKIPAVKCRLTVHVPLSLVLMKAKRESPMNKWFDVAAHKYVKLEQSKSGGFPWLCKHATGKIESSLVLMSQKDWIMTDRVFKMYLLPEEKWTDWMF